MLRLTLLGGASLTNEEGSQGATPLDVGVQPRLMALLALLAVAGDVGRSRDKLVGWLWPERSAEHARHGLRQALYQLRTSLGHDVIVDRGTTLALEPSVTATDVGDFRAAFDARDWKTAVTQYRGPFLDGFFLSNAPEFERWAEDERARFARDVAFALEALAGAATAAGDHVEAARLLEQLAAMDPLNTRIAAKLVSAVATTGDLGGALQQVERHQKLRRDELGAAPDVALQSFARNLVLAPAAVDVQPLVNERYAIERLLERRSAVARHLALDRQTGHTVALNVIAPVFSGLSQRPVLLRCLREAMQLDHPTIVPILDVGVAKDCVYYITPHCPGETLREQLDREQQLGVAEVIVLARTVASALTFAHERGVLHLDLKPKHLVLDEGAWRLRELGVASALRAAMSSNTQQTAVAFGTPAYMSPEQAAGTAVVDARSDLYSLGCVLYHALSGAPPLVAPTPQAIIGRRLTERVPPIRIGRDSVPRNLDAAVRRLLARSPADRFHSAAEFATALTTPATTRRRQRPS